MSPQRPTRRTERLKDRQVRLQRLLAQSPGPYDKAVTAISNRLSDSNRYRGSLDTVRIRHGFIDKLSPDNSITSDLTVKTPAVKLMSPNGHSLKLSLILLAYAQMPASAKNPSRISLPIRPRRTTEVGISDFVILDEDNNRRGERSKPLGVRQAQAARNAIVKMKSIELVACKDDQPVRLYQETGIRSFGPQVAYTPPDRSESFGVPIEFFTNGWVLALDDAEIVSYLMYQRLYEANGFRKVNIDSTSRRERFSLSTSSWEKSWILSDTKVFEVETDQRRLPNGTIQGFEPDMEILNNNYSISENAFDADALSSILKAIERKIEKASTA